MAWTGSQAWANGQQLPRRRRAPQHGPHCRAKQSSRPPFLARRTPGHTRGANGADPEGAP
eukprot:5742785-Lingulodinium_polyedra.AAC.1